MAGQPLYHRLQALFWEHSPRIRLPLRRLRRRLSLAAYRLRSRLGAAEPPRIVPRPEAAESLPHPAIAVTGQEEAVRAFLAGQTEASARWQGEAGEAPYCLPCPAAARALPPTWLESLLLVAAAEDLPFAQAGLGAPAEGAHGPSGRLHLPAEARKGEHLLLRLPRAGEARAGPVLGRAVPQIAGAEALRDLPELSRPLFSRSGPYLLAADAPGGRVHRQPLRSPFEALRELPPVEGPPTVLFLLPFLAVGGAERLLFDLLDGLGETCRSLVVTFEPHLARRGQTVERCRRATPHVYTLGDWLPREARLGALLHLLRRYRVESLVSWNGTVDFYDGLAEIKAAFPGLRVLSQHFNHRGAWIERITPSQVRLVDLHLAVNQPIARALERERGIPREAIRLVHHGVGLPPEPSPGERAARRRRARERLGLPEDAVVAGTFVRLHPQKRPGDVLRLARSCAAEGLFFLLAGGGPLDQEIDRRLAARPLPNLLRLPMQEDVEPLYEAVDLCLSTSAYEGLPVFLIDGLARGIPCVATAVGDIPYLLAEGGGIAAGPPGDLEGLRRALLRMRDPELRRTEGEKGRRRVESELSLEPYCRRYREAIFPGTAGGEP